MAEDRSIFITLPYPIFNAKLSGDAKLVLGEITNLLKVNRRWCWASNTHFAEMFNLGPNIKAGRTQASRLIKELEKEGWVKSDLVKICKLDQCGLKGISWHRHIFPNTPLSNLLDSLLHIGNTPITHTTHPITNDESQKEQLKTSNIRYLKNLPNIDQLKERYPALKESQIRLEAEKAYNWLTSKGRTYKNYESFFRNWLLRVEGDSPGGYKCPNCREMEPQPTGQTFTCSKCGYIGNSPQMIKRLLAGKDS